MKRFALASLFLFGVAAGLGGFCVLRCARTSVEPAHCSDMPRPAAPERGHGCDHGHRPALITSSIAAKVVLPPFVLHAGTVEVSGPNLSIGATLPARACESPPSRSSPSVLRL